MVNQSPYGTSAMSELITDNGKILTTDDLVTLVTDGCHSIIEERIRALEVELAASRSEIRKAQIDRAIWELEVLRGAL